MKIAHIGDTHFGMVNYAKDNPMFGYNDRLADYVKCLHFAIDTMIDRGVECVLFAGDAYKNRFPDATQKWHFESEMLRLLQHGIYIVAITGNHDSRGIVGANSSLDSLNMLHDAEKYVTLFNMPGHVTIHGKHDTVTVSAMPWPTRQFLFDDLTAYKLPADKMYTLLKTYTDDKLRELNEDVSTMVGSHILLGHLDVDVAEYSSEQTMVIKSNLVTEAALLKELDQFGYIALGHIHKHQNVGTIMTPIVYCGSIERVDFSEEHDKKGFCIFDIEDNMLTSNEFIETPTRPMWTLYADLTDESQPTSCMVSLLAERVVSGSICRVKYTTAPGCDVDWSQLRELTNAASHFQYTKAPVKAERHTNYAIEHTTLRETLTTYLREKNVCSEDDIEDVLKKAQLLLNNKETL